MSGWKLKSEITKICSKWVTIICERWLDEQDNEIDYWRVEKPDSVIIIPIQNGRLICTKPYFRPGIKEATLDFPGGRLKDNISIEEMVYDIMHRELGVPKERVCDVVPLNKKKWILNSSFSNQGVWGFVARVDNNFEIPISKIGLTEKSTSLGAEKLLGKIECLQCRCVLHEWKNMLTTIHSK
jgi:hypothetical protein